MSASSPVTMVKLGRGPPVYRGTSLHTCTSVIPYGLNAYVGLLYALHMYALHMQSKERQKDTISTYVRIYLLCPQSVQILSGVEKYSTDLAKLFLSLPSHRQTDTV